MRKSLRLRGLHIELLEGRLLMAGDTYLVNFQNDVTVAVGDPANNDGMHTINVEGVNYWNAVADTNSALMKTMQVTVSDGRLTIDSGTAANAATRIDFVHIVGLANGPNSAPT